MVNAFPGQVGFSTNISDFPCRLKRSMISGREKGVYQTSPAVIL